MAAYISFQPSGFFSTKLYTGTGSELAITGIGFQPDWVWTKARTTTDSHVVCDSVRGATKVMYPNSNGAEATEAETLKSFDSDGYTVGTNSGYNTSSGTYVSWNWKAGTTSGITTNGSTTITPSSYSFDQTAGISIINYTGNSTSGAKVAHGLGVVPQMMIIKNRDAVETWTVYHKALGNTKYLIVNTTSAAVVTTNRWNDTDPDSVNFTVGNSTAINVTGEECIAYCFTDTKGFSKFGSYTGNGNADGPFLYTGFRPAFVMVKRYDTTGDWFMWDDKRLGYNPDNNELYANNTDAEATSDRVDLCSNGFKLINDGAGVNNYTGTYIYMAFAEFPIVSSNDVPTVAR